MDLELSPSAFAAGGDAIARDEEGRVVFVEGALPGERVRARVVQAKKDFARAVTVDVLAASPDRVDPTCGADCSGCTWQHVSTDAQGRHKVAIVDDALRRIGRFPDGAVTVRLRPPAAGETRPRRTTVRLGAAPDGRLGERRRGTREVIPRSQPCRAVHPLLYDLVLEGRVRGVDEVVLRAGVASGERGALGLGGAPSATIDIVMPDDVAVGAHAVVHESVAGAWLRVSMPSFFQAGAAAAEALVAAVDEAVGDAIGAGGHLVDAYAGVGLFGATLGARRDARVTSIESDTSANADARVNLAELDAVVVEGEVGHWRPVAGDPPADVVIADPARPGLGRPGVAAVVAAQPERLVLVSCDPASFARDARLLADLGYRPSTVELVDAFPDTFHVEVVTRFDPA